VSDCSKGFENLCCCSTCYCNLHNRTRE